MKKRLCLFVVLLLVGCATMLPSIQSQHPAGFAKLTASQTECQTPDLKNYSACFAAAQLLESFSPEQITTRFLAHWEETAFGLADRKEKIGEARYDPGSSYLETSVWGSVKYDSVRASERIVLPVLKKLYEESGTEYGNKMLKQTDLIILDSRSSFDTFRTIHTQQLN